MNDLIIGPQTNDSDYYDITLLAQAKLHGELCPAVPPADPEAQTIIYSNGTTSFNLLQYYDQPLSLYTAYKRTGDPQFLSLARKCADAWYKHPTWIGEGRIRLWPDNMAPPPRHAGVAGLLLRALDGRPEIFDWVNTYTDYAFFNYVGRRTTKLADGTWKTDALYDLREGAFSFRFKVWLSQLLPDSFPNAAQLRTRYIQEVEIAAEHYFSKSQRADGSYPWNDAFTESDSGTLVQVTQPFIAGLLLRALCDAHQVVVTPSVKENIKNQILNGCRHLYSGGPYIKDEIEVNSGKRIRGFHYYYGGGTSVNPTRYANGDIKFPWRAAEAWWVPGARQAISTILGSFGYAYKISGDEYFKIAGDEMYDSAYSGRDGLRALMGDNTSKNFNQHVMGSSSYKAWVGGVVATPVPQPVPQPIPVPTPTPQPIPPLPTPTPATPSPNGFKGVEIVDSRGKKWTIGENQATLCEGEHMGGGQGSIYKFVDSTVYTLGLDSNWWKWDNGWKMIGAEPGVVTQPEPTPTPTPTPAPEPIPPTPCSISAPASVTIRANGMGTIAVTLQNLNGLTEVKVIGSDGQATVSPLTWSAGPASAVKQFSVRVKRQSRTITFQSPCGSVSVRVNVT